MKKIKFNKKLGKKAMTASVLVSLIITLVAFTLIAGTLYRFMDKADDKQAEILCHDSIAMRAKTQVTVDGALIGGEIKLGPILCKTIEKKIKGSREEIKREIAEKVARCWWMFGEGRYEEILHSTDIDVIPALFDLDERKNQCFNCYYLMIDQNTIEPNKEWRLKDANNAPIGQAELTEFMWDEKPLKTAPTCENGEGEDCWKCETEGDCDELGNKYSCQDNWCVRESAINYYKYIQYYGGPGQFDNLASSIQGRHAYTISFLPKNKPPGGSIWMTVAVGAAVVIVGTGVILCTLGTMGICGGVAAAAGTAAGTAATAGTAAAASTTVVAGTATTVAGTSVALSTGGIFIPVAASTGTVAASSVATASTAAAATATAATATTASTATAAVAGAGTLVKAGVAVAAGTGIATYGAIQGIQEIKLEDMFKERELSSVYLADAQEGQNFCVHGDIGGE